MEYTTGCQTFILVDSLFFQMGGLQRRMDKGIIQKQWLLAWSHLLQLFQNDECLGYGSFDTLREQKPGQLRIGGLVCNIQPRSTQKSKGRKFSKADLRDCCGNQKAARSLNCCQKTSLSTFHSLSVHLLDFPSSTNQLPLFTHHFWTTIKLQLPQPQLLLTLWLQGPPPPGCTLLCLNI